MSGMRGTVVTRSIRVDADFDAQLQAIAADEGKTVSAYMRDVLAEDVRRRDRQRRRRRALEAAARLQPSTVDRDEVWGVGDRVPR